MSENAADIDTVIRFLLEKLSEEFEIVKRQGFPEHRRDYHSQFSRKHDVKVPERRWRTWAYELGIDYTRLESVLKVLEHEGLLEKYKFIPDYI